MYSITTGPQTPGRRHLSPGATFHRLAEAPTQQARAHGTGKAGAVVIVGRMTAATLRHMPRVRPARWLAGAICALALLVLAGCGSTPKSGGAAASGHSESGQASYYGNEFHGRKTANGERFDQGKLTAAHRTLPFGTRVKVTNTQNGKSVIVRVNDRGPFVKGRVIDLSSSAFKSLASLNAGVVPVRLQVID